MRHFSLLLAVLSAAVSVIVNAGCGTPFFPSTGTPSGETRSTPGGVVQQLVKSYESRRIDLFEELLYSDVFRFYVELDLEVYSDLNNIPIDRTENVSLDKEYNPDGAYVYLTFDEEKAIHQKLFTEALYISFDKPLTVMEVQYLQALDGTVASDSASAEYAVVHTDNASIRVASDVIKAVYEEEMVSFPVGQQVFYLKKDDEKLWRILYWFELAE